MREAADVHAVRLERQVVALLRQIREALPGDVAAAGETAAKILEAVASLFSLQAQVQPLCAHSFIAQAVHGQADVQRREGGSGGGLGHAFRALAGRGRRGVGRGRALFRQILFDDDIPKVEGAANVRFSAQQEGQ